MNRIARVVCLFSLVVMVACPLIGAPAKEMPPIAETGLPDDERMAWWREARFGMFLHWGLYAIPAGEWRGEAVPGNGEWIMHHRSIPIEEYRPLASQFDPDRYDPAAWAQAAQDAGMKYVVITAKHHDGFCLFDTAATDWDVVDATPYGKDLLEPLAAECRERGLKFCTYYSILDWTHPSLRTEPIDKTAYVADMKLQLRELLDSCDPEVLWFDGEWESWWTEADGRDLYAYLRRLKPSLIINNRVGKGRNGMEGLNRDDGEYAGDFGTPEQQIPPTGLPGVDWESCMTMNDTWGFKKNDHNWKSAETLTRHLIDIASKGGNFLLNVGPTARGEIPKASLSRLRRMGAWMRDHGESIYATEPSPIDQPAWGRCTSKRADGGRKLYLHVFDWPADGRLLVPGIDREPVACRGLRSKVLLRCQVIESGLEVRLPKDPTDAIVSVVELDGLAGLAVIER